MIMAKETFGQRLARLRKEKELTQNDIADKVGVTSQAISKWENDLASPDIDMLIHLSDILSGCHSFGSRIFCFRVRNERPKTERRSFAGILQVELRDNRDFACDEPLRRKRPDSSHNRIDSLVSFDSAFQRACNNRAHDFR